MALEVFDVALRGHSTKEGFGSEAYNEAARATLDAVQSVVDALTDGKTGAYEACFTAEQGAFTALGARRISVSSKPLMDLPLPEAATIITGFTIHEIGHTVLTPTMSVLVQAKYGTQRLPHRVQNVIEDVRLEAYMTERHRGLVGVFDPTMEYVYKASAFPAGDLTYGQFRTIAERLNFVSAATRYRAYCTFGVDTETVTELAWWREWANVNGATTDDELMVRIEDALQHLHAPYSDEPEPEPEDEPGDEPGGESEGPTGYPGGTKPGTDEGESNDDSTEGDDESEPGDDTGTEGEDKPGDGGDEGGTEGGTDGDPKGDTKGDTKTDKDSGDSDTPATDPYRVGGGGQGTTPAADMDSDFDEDKAPKNFDDIASGDDDYMNKYRDQQTQNAVETERSSVKVNAGDFGTLKVHPNF